MEQDKNRKQEKTSEPLKEKAGNWIDKAEEFIDETAEKVHNSETYHKVDKTLEKATKSLFRKAGRWWGKL